MKALRSVKLLALAGCLACSHLHAAPPEKPPGVFSLSASSLAAARARLAANDAALAPALAKLREDADAALKLKPASVLDKTKVAASGDKHDFFSFAPYWWPDPSKPDGLPYIRRDGELNPESRQGVDSPALAKLCQSVETLGLAYYFTRERAYAEHAAKLTRVWFLDAATRMNPNFDYAQAIPGITPGRGIGIIQARELTNLCDGLALIADSGAWTQDDAKAMQAWLQAFYTWLTTSKNGLDEEQEHNNHGMWFDALTTHLALVLGHTDAARARLTAGLKRRLAAQVDPDGGQPHELARTNSLHYSYFNLEAMVQLANQAEHVGVDWWRFSTKNGRNVRGAIAYLAPYADSTNVWPKKDLEAPHRERIVALCAAAATRFDDAIFARALTSDTAKADASGRWRLLHSPKP